MTDTERGRQVIERAGGGQFVALARAVAPAVFVEPGLLRHARLTLLPGTGIGVESELWFSPLVLTRNATGVVLDPDVLTALREQLAQGDAGFAERACRLVRGLHEHYPATLRLEEELVWESIQPGAAGRIERKLRPAVKALTEHPDGGHNVARWAAQAWHRLPESVRETEAAQLLAVASSLRIGRAIGTARPGDHGLPATSLTWLRPSSENRPDHRIGLRLATDGLRFVAPDGERLVLELPATSPPVVEVGWTDEAVHHQRIVPATEGTAVQLGENVTNVVLRALDGRRYLVRPRRQSEESAGL
ncbi:MAG: hypothetical protein LC808_00720 [Actinobacteria bacterium]|nr:hypothetical protein [Actinomycetota bacterium]